MKNAIKLLGLIAIVAIIGFSFAACDSSGGGDDGGGGGGGGSIPAALQGKWGSGGTVAIEFKANSYISSGLEFQARVKNGAIETGVGSTWTVVWQSYTISGNQLTLKTPITNQETTLTKM